MAAGWFNAITDGRFQQVKYLVGAGIDPNIKNHSKQNALVAALQINHDLKRQQMFNYLLHIGVDARNRDIGGRDVLMWTAILQRRHQFLRLVRFGGEAFDLTVPDRRGYSLLHYVCCTNDDIMLNALLDIMKKYDLPVDMRSASSETPYAMSKRLGHDQMAKMLEKAGASTEIFDWDDIENARRNNKVIPGFRDSEKDLGESRNPRSVLGNFNQKMSPVPSSTKRFGSSKSQISGKLKTKQNDLTAYNPRSLTSRCLKDNRPLYSRSARENPDRTYRYQLPRLLTLWAVQSADTYRPKAVAPPGFVEISISMLRRQIFEKENGISDGFSDEANKCTLSAVNNGGLHRNSIATMTGLNRRRSSSIKPLPDANRLRRHTLR